MDEKTNRIVDALVSAGLIDGARREQAVGVVTAAAAVPVQTSRVRSKLGEIAGYAGAALVVAAGVVFIMQEWSNLSDNQRVAWIGAMAGVLALAGIVTSFVGTGFRGLREESGAIRRRLAGTLYTGTAISAGIAVTLEVDHIRSLRERGFNDAWMMVAMFTTLAIIGLVGYLAAPTIVGLLPIAVGSFAVIPATLELFDLPGSTFVTTMALLEIALALVWWGVSEIELAQPRQIGLAIALTIGVIAAQMPVWSEERPNLGYLLSALVAVGAFIGYVARPAWAYLGAGVVAVTLVVPEALHDWTSGSIGTAGSVLLAGVTLLAASLLSFKLHHESAEHPRHHFHFFSRA